MLWLVQVYVENRHVLANGGAAYGHLTFKCISTLIVIQHQETLFSVFRDLYPALAFMNVNVYVSSLQKLQGIIMLRKYKRST